MVRFTRWSCIGMKRTASAKKNSRSSASSSNGRGRPQYAVCLQNRGYASSLEPRKLYRVLPDAAAARHKMIRVVDESGEDYLYPNVFFASLNLPVAVRRKM